MANGTAKRLKESDECLWEQQSAELKCILDLAREQTGPILELGCGSCMMTIPLARVGYEVYGVDSSMQLLESCKEAVRNLPPDIKKRIHFAEGRLSQFRLPAHFALIVVPLNRFWFNLNPNDAEGCLCCMVEHLQRKGKFLIDSPVFYETKLHVHRHTVNGYQNFCSKHWWSEMAKKYGFTFKTIVYPWRKAIGVDPQNLGRFLYSEATYKIEDDGAMPHVRNFNTIDALLGLKCR